MDTLLVGCGRMGGALLRGWIAAGVGPVSVIDPNAGEIVGAQRLRSYEEVLSQGPLCVVVAVKPGLVAGVLEALRSRLGKGSLVISVAAGVTLAQMRRGAGEAAMLVRTMPNTPAAIGKGAIGAVSDADLDPATRAHVDRLLNAAGAVFWLETEALIDAVTAISGSGPAYFYRFTEAMASAGRALGLTPEMAQRLAELTFTGSAAWMETSGESPAELRTQVTSPNGVTAAALSVFDQGGRLDALLADVAQAAVSRSAEMSGV